MCVYVYACVCAPSGNFHFNSLKFRYACDSVYVLIIYHPGGRDMGSVVGNLQTFQVWESGRTASHNQSHPQSLMQCPSG